MFNHGDKVRIEIDQRGLCDTVKLTGVVIGTASSPAIKEPIYLVKLQDELITQWHSLKITILAVNERFLSHIN